MIVTAVHIWVKTGFIPDFIKATIENHQCSVNEPGNLRFDLLQSREDPSRFLLYEAYTDEQSAKAHKETSHYKLWRETVAPWMAKNREGIPYDIIAPINKLEW